MPQFRNVGDSCCFLTIVPKIFLTQTHSGRSEYSPTSQDLQSFLNQPLLLRIESETPGLLNQFSEFPFHLFCGKAGTKTTKQKRLVRKHAFGQEAFGVCCLGLLKNSTTLTTFVTVMLTQTLIKTAQNVLRTDTQLDNFNLQLYFTSTADCLEIR